MKQIEHAHLKINGRHFNKNELAIHAQNKLNDSKEKWEQEIYAFILYWLDDSRESIEVSTSGSTGNPKMIRIKKDQMRNSAEMTLKYFGLTQNDNILLCLPVKYIAGKMMLVRAFTGSLNVWIVPPTSCPLEHLDEQFPPMDFCAMTPMQVHHSIQKASLAKRFQSINRVIIGGGNIPYPLRASLRACTNNIYATYGMTETASHIAINQVSKNEHTIFEVLPGIDISTDERNCLSIYAPQISSKRLATNDIVELISPNRFLWKGRLDNTINSGGIKINPEAMEEFIAPFISTRFVISYLANNITGQELVLVLEGSSLHETATLELLSNIRMNFDFPVHPKQIKYLTSFPETGFGKVNRKEIIQLINQ